MKQIFDQLKADKKMVEANSPEELKQIVDQDLAYLEGVTFSPYDSSRQALNTRIINLTQLPIDIGKDNEPSYIKKPSFIYPVNNTEVPVRQLYLLTDPFKIIGYLKDNHKSTIWQMSLNDSFSNLIWERESLIFKTQIHLPDLVKEVLVYGKDYYLRAKYRGKKYESEWSDVIKIAVQKILIEKPYLVLPPNEGVIDETNFKLIASPFRTEPLNSSTHVSTLWHIAEDEYFQETIWKDETTLFLTEVNVPSLNILPGKTYYIKFQYKDNWDSKSSFSDTVKVYSRYKIEKPTILEPTDDSIISRREITVIGDAFTTFPISINKMKSYEVCIARDINFYDKAYEIKREGEICNFLIPYDRLDLDTVYYIRIRYYGENEKSDWSDSVAIRTSKINIIKPEILSPIEDSIVSAVLFNINCSEFTTEPINDDIHIKTTYEISKDIGFTEKLYELPSVEHLSFLSLSKPSLFKDTDKIFIRIKFHGLKGDSEWSDIREVMLFSSAIPTTPILEKRLKTSPEFGSDQVKNTGRLITEVILNDNYDSIVWSKWLFATDSEFGTNREERILSIDPKVFKLNIVDPYFQMDTEYFVKVAFKTLGTSEEKYSLPTSFKTGGPKQPIITNNLLINDTPTNHVLNITCSNVMGANNYAELNETATLEISSKDDFSILLDRLLDHTQDISFTTGNVGYLKGDIYLRVKYDGFYFGETSYSDTVKLELGSITKPEILSHIIQYDEITEDLVETYIILQSSEASFPEGRKDTHTYSKWLICSDPYQTNQLQESFTYELTDKKLAVDLNVTQTIYTFVKYFCPYFNESEWSSSYEIILPSFIFTPVIIKPISNEILLRENVIIEVKPFKSVPTVSHDKTKWVISSDLEGLNVVWELESTVNLISIPVPNEVLDYGATYYAHVTFFHGEIKSQKSIISFSTESTGSLKVILTPQDAIDNGAQWRRVGTTVWLNSGYIEENLANGDYIVEFNLVAGYNPLNSIPITINAGITTEVTQEYDFADSGLQVIILPESAAADGAQWSIAGTDVWYDSGAIVEGLTEEEVTIEFLNPLLTKYVASEPLTTTLTVNTVKSVEVVWLVVGEPSVMKEAIQVNNTLTEIFKRTPPATVTITTVGDNGYVYPNPKIVNYYTSGSLSFQIGSRILRTTDNISIAGAEVVIDEPGKTISFSMLRENSILICNYSWLGKDPVEQVLFNNSLDQIRKKEKIWKISLPQPCGIVMNNNLNVVRRKEAIKVLSPSLEANTSLNNTLNLIRRKNSIVIP